uniref:Protein LURP-one-related 8 n=2 Tax=Rhizophora mucronata TaxID=61149 RepID=A0A2P2ILU0_RHIMU
MGFGTGILPGMTKVHPNVAAAAQTVVIKSSGGASADAILLTVWKKSLLFNCNGFTVFDAKGNLVFRVDNYMTGSGAKGEILLMDAAGNPLLTIRRKRLSLSDSWLIYDGETTVNPRFSMRKHANILNSKSLAHVSAGGAKGNHSTMYEIEGSYGRRCCAVYDGNRRRVAEVKQKEAVRGDVAFGDDVFRLIVLPEMDASVAMAIVIILDQMFGSSTSRRF